MPARPPVRKQWGLILFISHSKRRTPVEVTRSPSGHQPIKALCEVPFLQPRIRSNAETLPRSPKGAKAISRCGHSQLVLTITGPIPLAPNDVKGFFTLFPKCFSSFVHTTCSLSDLMQYLAFAEVHLRFSTALSNCTTRGVATRFPCAARHRTGR